MVKWAYGVTTVPSRRGDLLPRTLASLRHAGFPTPRLFLDGASHAEAESYEEQFKLPVTARGPDPVKVCGNWWLGMQELYLRDPAADRFAMFQDDIVAVKNLRPYLDKAPWPLGLGYGSLYTASATNESLAACQLAGGTWGPGGVGWIEAGILDPNQINPDTGQHWQAGRGALGLAFNREVLVKLLSHQHILNKAQDLRDGWRQLDGAVVTIMNLLGLREFIHCPSLLQHTGEASTMRRFKLNKPALTFPGEMFDALAWFNTCTAVK